MITYQEACKQLKKVGTAKATGDALCAMYARLITFHCRLDGPKGSGETTKAVYRHLGRFNTDMDITDEGRRLIENPSIAVGIAFPEDE